MAIKLLPEQVINQIAAGEVVERPSSVVKELVDNALDSGTDRIKIIIQSGGLRSIEVIDNGCGMGRDDALLSFERHATSKISMLSDLENIETNGFRGEALSSITSVAQVFLKTKQPNDAVGTTIEIRGGKLIGVNPASLANGTSIEVKNLFFNVPARKKFLKSQRVEEARIQELVIAYALAYPQIEFELISDEKSTVMLPAAADRIARAKRIIKGSTTEVNYKYDEIQVYGLVGHPGNASSQGSGLTIIVNKRFVHDRFILRAIKEGFSSTLKDREFPIGVIEVVLPGFLVDVNVHPQKSEVRFSNPQKVFAAVKTAIEESVKEFRSTQVMSAPYNFGSSEQNQFAKVADRSPGYVSSPIFQSNLTENPRINFDNQGPVFVKAEATNLATERYLSIPIENYRFLGQIFKCYLLFEAVLENENKFVIIDMHAAHERIQYNKIFHSYRNNHKNSQKLLLPIEINLSPKEVVALATVEKYLLDLGFEWSFSDAAMIIESVPTILQKIAIEPLFKEILRESDTGSADFSGSTFSVDETIAYICARRACHSSHRGGDVLSREESYSLLEQILTADFGSACPHGRPCILEFNQTTIENWFGRDK